MKTHDSGDTGKPAGPRPRPANPIPTNTRSEKKSREVRPVSGISKLKLKDLQVLARQLGLKVDASDRRADLISRIREPLPATRTPPSVPVPVTTGDPIERPSGWAAFSEIPYEPVRREHGHAITLLAVTPLRIMAFFSVDWNREPEISRRIRESGLFLKIRDVTGAVESAQGTEIDPLPADSVIDIDAGMADRWSITLPMSHRELEAWLGFYHEREFQILARSKRIRTPRGAPSPRTGTLFLFRGTSGKSGKDPGFSVSPMGGRWTQLPNSREFTKGRSS